jgi:hypothetical protein
MREIGHVRREADGARRRWFQDRDFDLYVWQDEQAALLGFQLCYRRGREESVIAWNQRAGFSHGRVDTGENAARAPRTPVLRDDGPPPYFRLYDRFLQATEAWEPALRQALLARLREYRRLLFGSPRKPRRTAGRGA